jgi:hypothetical protein
MLHPTKWYYMTKQKVLIGGLDTETDHEPDGSNARIVQWAIVIHRDRSNERRKVNRAEMMNAKSTIEYTGYTLSELRTRFETLMTHQSTKYVLYVHNLNYDFQFMRGMIADIIDTFEVKESESDEPRTDMYGVERMELGAYPNDREGCFVLAPNNRPAIVRFGNIELRDSSKKLPAGTTVKEMGEMLGMPKLESPRGDFHPGWSSDLTDDDFQYVIRDAEIVAVLMAQFHKEGATHATISSDAMASAKTIFNKHHNVNGYGQYKKYFPELDYDTDRFLRKGYMGGINYAAHIGLNQGPIVALDVNSMYPTVMKYDLLPFGVPIKTNDPEADGYQLYVVRAKMKFNLKPGMCAVFKFKHKEDADMEGIKTSDAIVSCEKWHELTLTNIDIANYSRFYDIQIKSGTAVYLAFNGEVGLMGPYIDYWFEVKRTAPKNSVRRALAKLMLNSLYGRFGFSPDVSIAYFGYDEDIDDIVLKSQPDQLEEVPGYLPYAMFVTANARRRLCDGMLTVGCPNVVHCDTDSVKYLGGPELSKTLGHTDALGDWKVEDTPAFMIEGGVKRYVELAAFPICEFSDVLAFTCAGMPQKMKDGVPIGMWVEVLDDPMAICDTGRTFGSEAYSIRSQWLRDLYESHGMNPDNVNTMRLLPRKVKGGVLLVETTFVMHDNMISRSR